MPIRVLHHTTLWRADPYDNGCQPCQEATGQVRAGRTTVGGWRGGVADLPGQLTASSVMGQATSAGPSENNIVSTQVERIMTCGCLRTSQKKAQGQV